MGLALDLLGDFIEDPRRAARTAADRRPFALAVLCLLFAAASLFAAQAVSRRFLPVSSGFFSLFLLGAWTVTAAVVLTGVLHLIADFWGRTGSAAALFTMIAFSELAWALVLPVALILKAAGLDSWFSVLLTVSAAGWLSMRLKARGLRDVYRMSPARAWSLLLLPYMAFSLLLAAAVSAAIVGTAMSLFKLAA